MPRALLTVALLLAACGSGETTTCALGDQVPCMCDNGDQSLRICLETGEGYSSCIGCSSDGSSVPPIQADMARAVATDDGGVPDFSGTPPKSGSCSPTTCTGCCDDGRCVLAAAQTDAVCHVGSLGACQQCPSGFHCLPDEACAKSSSTCDATSCPDGCCDGNVCLTAGARHCGKGGGACASCAPGSLCTDGSCQNDLDPDAIFYVTINTVDVQATDASGTGWDTVPSSPPDLKVCFYDGGGKLACTKECSDQQTCTFSAAGPLTTGTNPPDEDDALGTSWPFYGSELMSGLPFRVWDMDYVPLHRYDTIASGTMFKITKLQTQYAILPFQRVIGLTFTLTTTP